MGDSDKPGVFFLDESGLTADCAVQQKPRPNLPEQTNYDTAEKMAQETIARMKPERQAKRCGAVCRVVKTGKKTTIVELDYLGRKVQVTFPDGQVSDLAVWERILVLHYLGGDSTPPTHTEWVDFKQIPSGGFYFEAFKRRAHDPLAQVFGQNPDLLLKAGEVIGARPTDFGDAAVEVMVFPKIPVVAVVHAADEEFPADAKILFKSSINSFFNTEDIAVIGGLVAGRLIKAAKDLS